MATVVVVGAGLGGLPTAYELRHKLPDSDRVVLISEHDRFTFIPGLIRVSLDLMSLDHIQLDLEETVVPKGIELVQGRVTAMDPEARRLTVENGQQVIDYDYVAIATGASLGFDLVPGLGPHGGYTHSVCTPDHALHAREAWLQYLENPGDLVVGAAPGAGCFGPAYEFVLMADWELRKRGLRDRVSITYISPEPYVGHLGTGGVKNAAELTGELMQKRDIEVLTNAEIVSVSPDTVALADGRQFPFAYAMILPQFRGAQFLRDVPELTNPKGFVPVTKTYRHPQYASIYALGVSVQLDQPEKTPIPIGLPKSGEMTEAMGMAVAHNIAVSLGAVKEDYKVPTLEALCFAEFGNTGIAYVAVPVVPDPATGKRRRSYALRGRWVAWVKAAFEEYFMIKMRTGASVPWFELLGLRLLFGLDLVRPTREVDNQPLKLATPR